MTKPMLSDKEVGMPERPRVTVTYSLDPSEDRFILHELVDPGRSTHVLWDIDQKIRNKLKYCEEDWIKGPAADFLRDLRSDIADSEAFKHFD